MKSYTDKQIQQFMGLGNPPGKFRLKWDDRESFFDEEVQDVLDQRHPDDIESSPIILTAWPVRAWRIVDAVVNEPSEQEWTHLFHFVERDRTWVFELLGAVSRWRVERLRELADDETPTALSAHRKWVLDRSLWESARLTYDHATAVKHNTLLKHPATDAPGVTPLPISEPLKHPLAYMDRKRNLSPEAYRQAVHRENAKRDKIMKHWAAAWLAHLGVTPA